MPGPGDKEQAPNDSTSFDWARQPLSEVLKQADKEQVLKDQTVNQNLESTELPGRKVITDSQMAEAEHYEVPDNELLNVGSNTEEVIGKYQSNINKFQRAVSGGLAKGSLTALENMGYMADVAEWTGIYSDFDGGVTNWLSDWASKEKRAFDTRNPIYEADDDTFSWAMQNLQGLIDSATGFAVPGGIAGKVVGRGAKMLTALKQGGFLTEMGLARFGTAAATNYAESMMMASELYENVYTNAIENGVDPEEAKKEAAKQGKEFIWMNKVNIATDAIALKGLLKGEGVIKGAFEKSKGQMLKEFGKQGVSEAWEEVSSGFMQHEQERDAGLALGTEKDDDSSYAGRFVDYATSEDGMTEALMGFLGGPFQAGAVNLTGKAVSKGVDQANKMFPDLKLGNKLQNPGDFKEKAPIRPEDRKKEAKPVDPVEKYRKDNVNVSQEDAETAVTQKEKDDYKKALDSWKLRNKDTTLAEYEKDLQEYNARKKAHAEKAKAFVDQETLANTGKKSQVIKDVSDFLTKENNLVDKYKTAVIDNDKAAMEDIENQRFEGVFARYAQHESLEGLKKQLEEVSKSEDSSQEERERAAKYLSKFDSYEIAYFQTIKKYGSQTAPTVFRTKQRMNSVKQSIKVINNEVDKHATQLGADVQEVEGKDMSATQRKIISLQAEKEALESIESGASAGMNPSSNRAFKAKKKDLQDQIDTLSKENIENVPVSVFKEMESYKDMVSAAKSKSDAWSTFKSYEGMYKYMMDGRYQKDVHNENKAFLEEQVDTMINLKDVAITERMIDRFELSEDGKKEIIGKFRERTQELFNTVEEERIKYESYKERQESLIEEEARIKKNLRAAYGKMGHLTSKKNALTKKLAQLRNVEGDELGAFEELSNDELLMQLDDPDVMARFIKSASAVGEQDLISVDDAQIEEALSDLNNVAVEISRARQTVRSNKYSENNIKELLDSNASNISSYDNSPYSDFFNNRAEDFEEVTTDVEETGAATIKPNMTAEMAEAGAIIINPIDDEDESLTSELDSNASKKRVTKLDAKEVADIQVGDREDNKTSSPDKEAARQASLKRNKEFSIAYYSYSDGTPTKNTSLVEWLETTPELDKVGLRVRLEFDTSYKNGASKKFEEGKPLSDAEIKTLPIKMVVLNEEGKPYKFKDGKGKEGVVSGHLRNGTHAFKDEYQAQRAENLFNTRKMVYQAFLQGGTFETKITKVGSGALQSGEGLSNNPKTHLANDEGKVELLVSTNGYGLINEIGEVDNDHPQTYTESGFVFAKAINSAGEAFPVKLNSRKLHNAEVDTIFNVIKAYVSGKKPSDKVEHPDFKGLTYSQVLELLVFEGPKSLDKKFPFYAKFEKGAGKGSLHIGDAVIPFQNIVGKEEEIKSFLGKMWRTTNVPMMNRTFDQAGFNHNFKWFGKDVKLDMSYNDFQFQAKALSTNASFPNERLFINPYVEVQPSDAWSPVKYKLNLKATAAKPTTPATNKTTAEIKAANKASKPAAVSNVVTKTVVNPVQDAKDTLNEIVIEGKPFEVKVDGDDSWYEGGGIKLERQSNYAERNLPPEELAAKKKQEAEQTDKEKQESKDNMAKGAAIGNFLDIIGRDVFKGGIKTFAEYEAEAAKMNKSLGFTLDVKESTFNSIVAEMNALKKELQGKGFQFVTEGVFVFSEYTAAEQKRTGFHGMGGTLDLVAIDKEGGIHIIDFKNKKYKGPKYHNAGIYTDGKFTSLAKKWGRQQTIYKTLAEKYGLNVKSINALPISTEYVVPVSLDTTDGAKKNKKITVNDATFSKNKAVIRKDFASDLSDSLIQLKEFPVSKTVLKDTVPVEKKAPEVKTTETVKPQSKKVQKIETTGRPAPVSIEDAMNNAIAGDPSGGLSFSQIAEMESAAKPVAVSSLIKKKKKEEPFAKEDADKKNENAGKKKRFDPDKFKKSGKKRTKDDFTPKPKNSTFKGRKTPIDIDKEVKELQKLLPNVPVNVVKGLIGVAGGFAEGQFYNGVITLSKGANEGVAYHEAFHAVVGQYLSKTEKENLFAEARERFGDGLNNNDVEELLAEEYREYQLTNGSLNVPKVFKWLYDMILDIVNLFRSGKRTIFSNLRAGRYDYHPPFSSSEHVMNSLAAPRQLIREAVDNMTYLAVSYSGVRSLDRSGLTGETIEDVFESVYEEYVEKYKEAATKANETGDEKYEKVAESFEGVLANFEDYTILVRDELLAYNLAERTDDKEVDENPDSLTGAKDSGLNIKPALLFDGKDNATGNTRLMVSMLAENTNSEYFGDNFYSLADFSKSWIILENNLSGLIDTVDNKGRFNTAQEKMLDRLKQLQYTYPPFTELVAQLESENVPQFKKTQFYSAFSKQGVEYSNSIVRETTSYNPFESKTYKDGLKWIVMNADSQSITNQIQNGWVENFKDGFVKNNRVANIDRIKTALSDFKQLAVHARKQSLDYHGVAELTEILNRLGVEVTEDGLMAYTFSQVQKDNRVKFLKVMEKLAYTLLEDTKKKRKKIKSVNVTLESMLKDDYVYDDENNFISDNKGLYRALSKMEAVNSNIPANNMVLGPDGNMYYTKSLNNHMSKTISNFKTDKSKLNALSSKVYHSASKWLGWMQENDANRDSFGMEVFLSNRVDDGTDSGTDFMSLTKPDELVERFNRTLFGVNNATITRKRFMGSSFSPLTFADKSMWFQITGVPMEAYDVKYNGNSWDVSGRLVTHTYKYILAEMDRINHSISDSGTVKHYNDGANKKLFWFPSLNRHSAFDKEHNLYDSNGRFIETEANKAAIHNHIKDVYNKQFQKTWNDFEDNNVITGSGNNYEVAGIDKGILAYYKGENQGRTSKEVVGQMVADYVANSVRANIEFTMVFSGDPAFYKDLSKRTPATIATGIDLMIAKDEQGNDLPTDFKVAVAKDITTKSSLYDNYASFLKKHLGYSDAKIKETLKPYSEGEMNRADAAAFITPTRFKNLMIGLGKWEPRHDAAFNKLMSSDPKVVASVTQEDLMMMQPLKGMHFEIRDTAAGEVDGIKKTIGIPTYLKYSQAPLWPGLVKGTPMENVYNQMLKDGIDELVFESGVKTGAENITDIQGLFEGSEVTLPSMTLQNTGWKLQQDLPSKYEKTGATRVGSQVKKNIMANMAGKVFSYEGKPVKTGEFIQRLNEVEGLLSEKGREDYDKKYGVVNGKMSKEGMKVFYKDFLQELKADRVSSNIIAQVEDGVDFDNIIQYRNKIMQKLYSGLNKHSVELKGNGGSFIQIPGTGFTNIKGFQKGGFDKAGIIWLQDVEELTGPTYNEKTGDVKPGQILLPFKAVKDIPGYESMSQAELKDALGDVITNLVGYRIPTQGTSSIDLLEIAGILPPTAGDSIVTYNEITGKTGSDFDIDKMYVMMYNTRWDATAGKKGQLVKVQKDPSTKRGLENIRLEMWASILTSANTFPELIKPLDSEWLKEDAYYLTMLEKIGNDEGDLFNEDSPKYLGMSKTAFLRSAKKKKIATDYFKNEVLDDLEFASPTHQTDLKIKNAAGQAGVGQTANQLVHHIMGQQAGLAFEGSIGTIDLSADFNENDEYINDIISAFLNAYVDNAKDPYISLLNNNTFTANTVFFMARMGLDKELINRFMSQPILKELSKNHYSAQGKFVEPNYETYNKLIIDGNGELSKTKVKNTPSDPINETLKKFGIDDITTMSKDITSYDKKELEKQLISSDPASQASVLKTFLLLQQAGDKLNDAIKGSKFDTAGAGIGPVDNFTIGQMYEKVINEGFIKGFDKLFTNTFIGEYKKNSFDHANGVFENILENTSGFKTFMREANKLVGNKYATNEKLNKAIASSYTSYIYSKSDLINIPNEQREGLFTGEASTAAKLRVMKKKYAGNPFIDSLNTKTEGRYSFVILPSSKKKDRSQADDIWIEWQRMLDDDTSVTTSGYKASDFARELVLNAYYSSGFNKGLNTFYDMIPHTYMRGEGVKNGASFNMALEKTKSELKGVYTVDSNAMDQMFRHNWSNKALVPSIGGKKLKSVLDRVKHNKKSLNPSLEGIMIDSEKIPSHFTYSDEGHVFVKPYFRVSKSNILYKHVGSKNGYTYFEAVSPLGYKERGKNIVEYNAHDTGESFVNDKKPGFPIDLLVSLTGGNAIDANYSEVQSEGLGGIEMTGKTTFTLGNIDGVSFQVSENTGITNNTLFGLEAVLEDGRTFSVSDLAETKEDALELGVEKLKKLGLTKVVTALNNACK